MKIFFKYIAKCMIEKKARFCLLILAIALSTGLLVTISGAVEVAISSFEKPIIEVYEGKDVILSNKEGKAFYNLDNVNTDGLKDIQEEINIYGKTKEEEQRNINVRGRKVDDINKDDIIEGSLENYKGEKCIISKRTSEDYNLKIGDSIEVLIQGESKSFTVQAISSNTGRFYSESEKSFWIVVPYEYLAKTYNVEGKYNYIAATFTGENVKDTVKNFNNNNNDFEASELFDTNAVEEQMGSVTSVLYVMLAIVVVMSAIIIFGSFKLTITERLPVIGTFLSQGATNWTIEKILFLESVGYGVIGGLFGSLIGYGGLYLVNYIVSPLKDYGIIEKFNINPIYLAIGLGFAVALSVISALVPISKIRRLEVKEVILNNVNISMSIGWSKFIIGLILMSISVVVSYDQAEWTNAMSPIFIIISVIALVLIYPKLIDIITNVLYKTFRGRSKSTVFSLNNLRTSKVLMGNITLIVISMLSIFMITSIGSSMKDMVVDAYAKLDFDVSIGSIQSIPGISDESVTNKIINNLKENDSIDADSIIIQKSKMGFVGETRVLVEGINKEKYKDFNGYLELNTDKYSDMYNNFVKSDENVLIISDALMKRLEVKEGEDISLKVNEVTKEFKILGSINGKLYQSGQFIMIDNNVLEREFGVKEASEIVFKTLDNPEEVREEILPKLKIFGAEASTKAKLEENNAKSNQTIVDVLSVFSYMAMFIAALGVLNNIIIGFLQRRRELAVLSSVGMSDGNRGKMLIIESILSVIWSMVIALPYSYLGLKLLSKTLVLVGMPLDVSLNINAIPAYFIAALAIILLATVPILFKSKKLSIINELKYE